MVALIQRREAVQQRQVALAQRDLARSGDLSSAALAELDDDPEVSLLLSIEGANVRPTARVENALRESIKASNLNSVYREHPGKVADLDFGPGGGSIASVGYENIIRVWDPTTGATRRTIVSPGTVFGLAFDPRGRWIAAAVSGGVFLWEAASGEPIRTLDAPGIVYQVEFSRDGSRIVGGGSGGTRVWNVRSGRVLTEIPAGPGGTYGADLSPDGHLVATGNGDGSVQLSNAETGRLLDTLEGHQDLGFFVRFSESGDRLISVAVDRTARVWDVHTGKQISVLSHAGLVQDADFFHEDYAVTADSEGVGRIWSISSGEVVSELVGHDQHIAFLTVDQTLDKIATASDDGTVRVWRAGGGVSIMDVHRDGYAWASEYIGRDSFLTAGDTDTIERWDSTSGALLDRDIHLDGPDALSVTGSAVSRDGVIIAAAVRDFEGDDTTGGAIVFLDVKSGRPISTFRREGGAFPLSVELDPAGQRAVSSWTDGVLRITDVDGTETISLDAGRERRWGGAAFSWDGSIVGWAVGSRVDLVDPLTGDVVGVLEGHDRLVTDLRFSPDGERVATASLDGTARVWDLRTAKTTATLRGHQALVESVAFSPDGNFLVTTASDGTARTWTNDGVEVQTFEVAESEVTSAVFSPDGRRILVTGLEGAKRVPFSVGYEAAHRGFARVYVCDVCTSFQGLLDLARLRVTRALTSAERSRYGIDG